ncbi:alpha/beta-hydrolase [Lophiostoma macrostomum CBS 122681]|uniref:Alpha/beta-hydrolase n=1 Tax=Lophiostoma macrostomum CBS 122681 TaxID=1314788 RepID=A0A6A6STK7_9PLEO|nr:alpha/beta-hydrolase [Lophiostoma macrostomum CBS 122681]
MRCSIFVRAFLGTLVTSGRAISLDKRIPNTMVYSFEDISPTLDLSWVPCFDNFTCTILQVPLDYSSPYDGNTTLAFIKIPSANATAEDILYNPGGPGGSGISSILTSPAGFVKLIGSQYNIVGFDPRGVNNSGISLDCFPDDLGAAVDFAAETLNFPINAESEFDVSETYLKELGFGQRCTAAQDPAAPKKYANTVAVANDMRYYTELVAKQRGQAVETSKLWYYGQSYGTILGQTFATLFPERIGRMVLDGVVDTEDYYSGAWRTSLQDTDAAFKTFFTTCFAAGPERCAFRGNATSAAELEQRFASLYNMLHENPILADPRLTPTPFVYDWRDLKLAIFEDLYNPMAYYPPLAELFVAVEQRNASALAAAPRGVLRAPLNNSVISCIDQAGRSNLSTLSAFRAYLSHTRHQSWVGGEKWIAIAGGPCPALDIVPPGSQLFRGSIGTNKTSTPILMLSSALDPVAPISGARVSSARFPGSALLEVNGTAVCTCSLFFQSTPSGPSIPSPCPTLFSTAAQYHLS